LTSEERENASSLRKTRQAVSSEEGGKIKWDYSSNSARLRTKKNGRSTSAFKGGLGGGCGRKKYVIWFPRVRELPGKNGRFRRKGPNPEPKKSEKQAGGKRASLSLRDVGKNESDPTSRLGGLEDSFLKGWRYMTSRKKGLKKLNQKRKAIKKGIVKETPNRENQ